MVPTTLAIALNLRHMKKLVWSTSAESGSCKRLNHDFKIKVTLAGLWWSLERREQQCQSMALQRKLPNNTLNVTIVSGPAKPNLIWQGMSVVITLWMSLIKYQTISLNKKLAVTSWHDSPLTLSAPDSWCRWLFNNLPKVLGKQLYENLHPQFLFHFQKWRKT